MENGVFFVVKEVFKKVLFYQYKFLKELKDVLLDCNFIKDLQIQIVFDCFRMFFDLQVNNVCKLKGIFYFYLFFKLFF